MYQLYSNRPNTHEKSPLCGAENVIKKKDDAEKQNEEEEKKEERERDHSSHSCR
jgi:hypothetical protein